VLGRLPILVRMSPLLLRAVRPAEADVLFGLHREATLHAYGHIFPPDRYPFPDEAMRDHWQAVVAGHGDQAQVIVAEVEGEAVGAVVAPPGRLESLFVVPRHWGAGAGSALHDAALAVTRAAGLASCRLGVLEENHRARRFYEHRGWRADGRRRPARFPPHPVVLGYTIRLSAQPSIHRRGGREGA
jgi:GNAT superfamily N-acetyltransferase